MAAQQTMLLSPRQESLSEAEYAYGNAEGE